MDKSDELQLMLVNTLRKVINNLCQCECEPNTSLKDLESSNPVRICLALDMLLTNCPMEAIPAVAPRLIDLLAHDSYVSVPCDHAVSEGVFGCSSHVKRKAMTIVRNISQHELSILTNVHEKMRLRLVDRDVSVAAAALHLLEALSRVRTKHIAKIACIHA
jgi:AP-4 complex subunit epsilon-1